MEDGQGEVIEGLVSVIVPVYNRSRLVLETVESVLGQTYPQMELILVDDGSTDDTPMVLEAVAGKHPETVTVVRKENEGPGLAREAGRQLARGEFIQYLDSDDLLLPRKFEEQVGALRKNPQCGIVYGTTRLVDEGGRTLREPSKWTGRKIDHLFPSLLEDRWWHTSTPLYRRSVSDAAGAWPKRRPEDWDLEARMGALRTRLVHCGTVVSCHREHGGAERVTRGSHEAYLRDEAWFLPRLHACAVQAGVERDAKEMQHFARWAFMRARHLGAMGEEETAWKLLELAERSATTRRFSLRIARRAARMFGWRTVGKMSVAWEGLRP